MTKDIREIKPTAMAMTGDVNERGAADSAGEGEPVPSATIGKGESIILRDFYGRVIETIGFLANGNFQTANGIIAPIDLGNYVIRVSGHPAVKHLD